MGACNHHPQKSTPPLDLPGAMRLAESHCVEAGERWTEPRRRTYELLLQAGDAVKAYDLIATYAGRKEPIAKPPTVYRALEFLMSQGLVHRIESLNAYIACRSGHAHAASEFLICDCCGRVHEAPLALDAAHVARIAAQGFSSSRIVLEIHGRCVACAA